MDGFSDVEYVHTPRGSILNKLIFHWKMLQSVRRSNADVIMFGFQAAHLIPFAWILKRRNGSKILIMDIRTIPVDVPHRIKGLFQIWRYNLSIWLADLFCDGITVITPMLGNSVRPRLRRLKDKIGVWSSGVNLNHFQRSGENHRKQLGIDKKKVLIYHGVLSPNRGLQNVVRALNILKNEYPDLIFLLVGDGPGRNELEKLVIKLNLSKYVRFVGKVPHRVVPAYVRRADLAILPIPAIEWWAVSSPIKLMEYLAAGIPVIATDIEAHRWVVNQTGGVVLVKNDQPVFLAESIRYALGINMEPVDPEKLQQSISWKKQAENLCIFLGTLRSQKQSSEVK